jgi:hypothetical protein
MAKTSKNSRAKSSVQEFLHVCGGKINMKNIFSKGKMKVFAECEKCGEIRRRPSEFDILV